MSAANLFVSNLPASASSDQLEQLFSEVGPVKRCFVVKDKDSDKCRGFGFVTFSMSEDAQRALNEIKEYGGQKIRVTLAKKKINKKQQEKGKKDQQEKESTDKEPEKKSPQNADGKKMNKKARLIIRNLSFKCSDTDLKELFSKFGTVLDVKIPLKPDGKKRGFAFVQFKNMLEAGKALAEMNLKEIKDRQVAVDWAVAKDLFVSTQSGSASGNKTNKSRNIKDTEVDEHSEDEDEPPVKKSKVQHKEDEHSELPSDDDDVDKDVEEDKDEEEEEYQHNGSIGEEIDSDDEQEDTDGSDDDDDDDDDDNDDDDDDDDDIAKQKKKKTKNLLPTDVNEGRTVFIRNLSFDSEEEGIEEVLLQFGELNYVRVVLHSETGHSKGCAFAQFKFKEGAEKCLAAAQNDSEAGGVRVDGRKLNIVLAVTREDAAKLATKKVKTHKGSRNLYLAREGLIRAGTKAAEGVSESDMAKRARFEDLKRAKLKDVNVFVSRTRLCIHNLPRTVDRQRLLQLCLSAAGGGKKARITECHVMYDRKPVRGEVTGRSLGYGFVEFKEHEHALQALRNLNNNPTIFSPNKRPIVEFSLEDSRKLKLKAKRLEKSKAKLASKPEKNQSHTDGEQDGKSKHSPCKTPGKGKAAGQSLDLAKTEKKGVQSSHYSGFRTTPEVEHVELEDGKKRQKVLPMPSHRGPKIRQREKGMNKQLVQSKKVKTGPSRKDRKGPFSLEKPNQTKKQSPKPAKKKFRNQDSDRFDSLVEQYKKKLMGASNSKDSLVKKGKWFS